MLARFDVQNFRNFADNFVFDFRSHKNYEFNTQAVANQIVRHGIIYSRNGGGKSNLGLAMLDITSHLNDIPALPTLSGNYLNANSADPIAHYRYEFCFDGKVVTYIYGKSDSQSVVYETLNIDGKCCVELDRRKSGQATFNLAGTENLKTDLSKTKISALKYLNANAVLDNNPTNALFYQFIEFVSGMVFFRTLTRQSEFHGQTIDVRRLSQAIIESDHIGYFEDFLNQAGIVCQLAVSGAAGEEIIEFVFDNKKIEFTKAASTGTISLGVFYYWWLKLESGELTFAYIDEFDAYYHHSLSKLIVKKLSQLSCQTLLTTHNTGIMSNDLLRPDCYFELKDQQYPFFTLVDKELRKAHNLEKIYKALTPNE